MHKHHSHVNGCMMVELMMFQGFQGTCHNAHAHDMYYVYIMRLVNEAAVCETCVRFQIDAASCQSHPNEYIHDFVSIRKVVLLRHLCRQGH